MAHITLDRHICRCHDGAGNILGRDQNGADIRSNAGEISLEDHLTIFAVPEVLSRHLWARVKMFFGAAVFIGKFMKSGHTGYIKYFAFKCDFCKQIAVSYPKGHEDRLECNRCN
ncbi:MAG TPA: hypothetical protein DCS06_01185 [Candidatus Yanofskybacteria bacterium]|nr:MAG: hypothetical protein A2241_02370 [Candidatus Yanofskybacteria bacterium RIFOXYA2_FULL_45_28]HAU07582.1 hypothetical protein [Candidatus Yanofskybacteria bacterium]HBX58721.1 hypothetical protein [Candidatus Yanofskybacteria bacterium]